MLAHLGVDHVAALDLEPNRGGFEGEVQLGEAILFDEAVPHHILEAFDQNVSDPLHHGATAGCGRALLGKGKEAFHSGGIHRTDVAEQRAELVTSTVVLLEDRLQFSLQDLKVG